MHRKSYTTINHNGIIMQTFYCKPTSELSRQMLKLLKLLNQSLGVFRLEKSVRVAEFSL